MKKILSMILLATLFATACNKDNNPSCAVSTTFLSGSYKITAATYKANASSSEANYFDILLPDACERDDIYTFQTNGTYQIKDAGTVCSPPGDDNGNWLVSGNTMIVDGDSNQIESFNCKTLVLSISDVYNMGDKIKVTFAKQ